MIDSRLLVCTDTTLLVDILFFIEDPTLLVDIRVFLIEEIIILFFSKLNLFAKME